MQTALEELINLARKHEVTAEERSAQIRSFAYGNTRLENEAITRSDIDEAFASLRNECGPTICT